MNTTPLAAFTFTFVGNKHLARSEDKVLLSRVSCAMETQFGIKDHTEIHENEIDALLQGSWVLINLDNTFDWEMSSRELFNGIDSLMASLLPNEPRSYIDHPL